MIPLALLTNDNTLAYEDGGSGGTATGIGALRWRDGKFAGSKAALVEEGTTNSTSNPILAVGTNEWNWGGATSRARDDSVGHDYATSYRTTHTAGSGISIRMQNTGLSPSDGVAISGGDPLAMEVWVYATQSVSMRIGALLRLTSGSRPVVTGPWVNVSANTWTKLAHTESAVDPDAQRLLWQYIESNGNIAADTTLWTTESFYEVGKDHHTSFTPEFDVSGNLRPGYAWTGTANNSPSTRAAASITIPDPGTVGSVACWYSEDFGATWSWHYSAGLGSIGTYGDISDTGSELTISSSRALLLGPLALFADTLTAGEQAWLQGVGAVWTWTDLLGPPPPLPDGIYGTGGAIDVWFELWRATIDNALVEDLSDLLTGGWVDINHDRAITSQAAIEVSDAARVSPYTDYLAVFLNRAYDDGRPSERDQLGLYSVRVPKGTRSIQRAEGQYVGHDLTAVLARYAFADTYNIAASTNYVTAVTTILGLAGITRHSIPPTTRTLAQAMSFRLDTTYLDACNTLLEGIGYYHLAATPDGRLTSGPTSDVRYVEPYRTISDDDLMGDVETQVTDTTVANIVIVVQDNFNAAPLTAVRRNDAADSPSSTVNLGPITRVEIRSNLADQDAVDALADRLLSEGRTWYQVAGWRILPDPGVLMPHRTIDLALTGKLAIFNGRWWLRTTRIGFDPAGAGPVIEANRVSDTIEGVLI